MVSVDITKITGNDIIKLVEGRYDSLDLTVNTTLQYPDAQLPESQGNS